MIITKLTGGLGNQLFQYAYGRACAIKNKTSLKLDISWYKGRMDRSYMLEHFDIKANIATSTDIFVTKIFSRKDYLVGDWQSEKYFKEFENIIRKEITPKYQLSEDNKIIIQDITAKNSVSIHLRGTDYVTGKKSDFHGVCSEEYYNKAITKIKETVPSPYFFIFTDDIEWAENHIKLPEPYTIVSKNKNYPWEDLVLMSSCKHNIIANSTFSWWAAWLNKNINKIVIAPKKWFNDEKIDTSDILPESWIKM